MKFAIFLKRSLLFNSFYCLFLFINKTSRLNNLKTRAAMNAKISLFLFCVKAITYLLLYNLHGCTFNCSIEKKCNIRIQINWVFVFVNPGPSVPILSALGPKNIARTNLWIKHITYSRLYLFKIKAWYLFKIFKKLFRKAKLRPT